MPAVIYARFSPRRNADKCESIETQLELCREYCEKNGIKIAAEFEDRALSGSEEDRPGLWNAVEALKRGYTLVVYRLDRLARSVYLSDIIERAVTKRRATIVSISGEGTWQHTDEDWLVRKILQTLAEYERKVIAARTKAAMLRHQRNGRRMSDREPFGFLRDPNNRALLIKEPNEQRQLRLIMRWHAEGHGSREIARRLEGQRELCRGRAVWYHSTIGKIIRRNKTGA